MFSDGHAARWVPENRGLPIDQFNCTSNPVDAGDSHLSRDDGSMNQHPAPSFHLDQHTVGLPVPRVTAESYARAVGQYHFLNEHCHPTSLRVQRQLAAI